MDAHPVDRPIRSRKVAVLLCTGMVMAIALLSMQVDRAAAILPPLPAETHPGLLFSAADLPVLRQRLEREPYATWGRTVMQRARTTPGVFTEERDKVRWAKSLAFAYLMTDSLHFAQRATELLLDVRFPPRDGDMGEPHHEGETIAIYATAYDMLHPFLESDPEALRDIRDLLAEAAQRIYAGIPVTVGPLTIPLHLTPHLSNWHVRAYGGLGLAALALSEYDGAGDGPQAWAERAHDMVTGTFAYQIKAADGGFAEGPFYLRYAADVYLPYLVAVRRRLGIDLFLDPRVRRTHAWSLNLRLPSGRRPNVGDAHLDDFYGHYLASVDPDGPVYRWDWENNSAGLYVRPFAEMDAIALFDDSIPARPPEHGPSVFMPGAGDAVFRSDWSAAAVYLLLRGEHGPVRSRSLAHGHPDETSFILYAGGEMLALDGGYIEFTQRHKVNTAAHHNLVLIDGEGPPIHTLFGEQVGAGNDAWIRDAFSTALLDYAEVETRYQDTDVRRRVFFPGHRYFVIADELVSQRDRQFEWRLHGNGGGTSGGTYDRLDGLARWQRPGAELLAFLPPLPGRTFAEGEASHSFNYREELTHTVLKVRQQGESAAFLAVLYPLPAGEMEPRFAAADVGGGQAIQVAQGDTLDVFWLAVADTVSVDGPAGLLVTDARSGWVRHIDGVVKAASVQDGAWLVAGNRTLLTADASIDAGLQWSARTVDGFVRGGTAAFRLDLSAFGAVAEARHGDAAVGADTGGGRVRLQLSGEGPLRLDTSAGHAADFDGSGRVDFQDFFLFAEAFGQPATGIMAAFDLNGDGRVGLQDFFLFAAAFGR